MIKRLAIIPARSGSRRIKNKNIKKFLGTNLINYSVDACIESNIFEKIHISTDSSKILNLLKKKIEIDFLRPKNLATDKTPLISVINYVLKKYNSKKEFFDEVWLIYATNPFINKKIIKNCSEAIKLNNKNKSNKNALMTVSEYNYPLEWAAKIDRFGFLKNLFPKKIKTSSQKLKKFYCDAGMLIVYPSELLINKKKIKFKPYILNKYETVDIDEIEDFNFAKRLKIK